MYYAYIILWCCFMDILPTSFWHLAAYQLHSYHLITVQGSGASLQLVCKCNVSACVWAGREGKGGEASLHVNVTLGTFQICVKTDELPLQTLPDPPHYSHTASFLVHNGTNHYWISAFSKTSHMQVFMIKWMLQVISDHCALWTGCEQDVDWMEPSHTGVWGQGRVG